MPRRKILPPQPGPGPVPEYAILQYFQEAPLLQAELLLALVGAVVAERAIAVRGTDTGGPMPDVPPIPAATTRRRHRRAASAAEGDVPPTEVDSFEKL